MKKDKPKLLIDFCSHKAAVYACEKFHYSKCIPKAKQFKLGVWENDKFKGVIIFGSGGSATLHESYGLEFFEVCELTRVALAKHETPVSRILAIAIKVLKKNSPKLKLIISFADPNEGHHGGIYQANNWVYTGKSAPIRKYWYKDAWRHATGIYKINSKDEIKKMKTKRFPGKHRYIFILDDSLNHMILSKKKKYPKRQEHESNAV